MGSDLSFILTTSNFVPLPIIKGVRGFPDKPIVCALLKGRAYIQSVCLPIQRIVKCGIGMAGTASRPRYVFIYGRCRPLSFSRLVAASIPQIPVDRPRSQRIFVFREVSKPPKPQFHAVGFPSRSLSFLLPITSFLGLF